MADSFERKDNRFRLKASALESVVSAMVGVIVIGLIIYGWLNRHEQWINPETGIGYALGIVGGTMMLVLLAYPVRKRVRRVAPAAGSVGFWFRTHMLLGLAGPLAILFHSRFTWGALNSAVALGAMLIVAGSGLIGRFLYSRVHRGFSGRKLELRALLTDMHDMLVDLQVSDFATQLVRDQLQPFEARAVSAGAGFGSSASAVLSLGITTRRAHRSFRSHVRKAAAAAQREADGENLVNLSARYFEAVRRAAEFAFYDRMLRLWHLLHLPLFFLLVASAILHIVAVHMY